MTDTAHLGWQGVSGRRGPVLCVRGLPSGDRHLTCTRGRGDVWVWPERGEGYCARSIRAGLQVTVAATVFIDGRRIEAQGRRFGFQRGRLVFCLQHGRKRWAERGVRSRRRRGTWGDGG